MFANPHAATLLAEVHQGAPLEHWLDQLQDGTDVLIRALCTDDLVPLTTFFEHLSPLSIRFRFLGAVAPVNEHTLSAWLSTPGHKAGGYVALIHHFGEFQVIGISRYTRSDDGDSCECTVAVADAWQRKGLGALLMSHLVDAARRSGFRRMTSTNLPTDYPIHRLYKRLGFASVHQDTGTDRLVHSLELAR